MHYLKLRRLNAIPKTALQKQLFLYALFFIIGSLLPFPCWAQQPIDVVDIACDFEINAQLTHPQCPGDASGSISLEAASVDGIPLQFQWLDINTSPNDANTINNLTQGTYSVSVFSETCTDTLHFMLMDPDPIIAPPLDTSICGSGSINVLSGVSGGSGNYTVVVNTLFGNEQDCNTCPEVELNSYTILSVEITDENGCTAERPIVVNVLPPLEANAVVLQPETCDDNGSIEINVSGGSNTNYFYRRLDANNPNEPVGNYQTSNIFNNLAGGVTYSFQVYDPEASCRTTVQATLGITAINIETALDVNNITCPNAEDGSIIINPVQDDLVVGYGLNDSDPNSTDAQVEGTFSDLAPGEYTVYLFISENQGCQEFEVEIIEPEPIDFQIETADASCEESADGLVQFSGTGGTGPLSYNANSLGAPADTAIFSNEAIIDTLSPGVYYAQVMDTQGCVEDTVFTINAPEAPPISTITIPSCPGEHSGSIVIVESGKLLIGYEFSIDSLNWQLDTIFTGLAPGIYTLYIRDTDTFCVFDDIQLQIIEVPAPSIQLNLSPPSCPNTFDGVISIQNTSTNTQDYQYSLDGIEFFVVNEFNNLGPGAYTLYVQDTFNCFYEFPFELEVPEMPNFNFQTEAILCYGQETGAIKVSVEGGTPPFEHGVNGSQLMETTLFTDLAAGNHTIYSRDANGCLFSNEQTISQSAPIIPNISIANETCSAANGVLSCAPIGGIPPYELAWNTGDSTYLLVNLSQGTYSLTITDSAACSVDEVSHIEDIEGPLLAAEPSNVHCYGASSGAINIEVLGGTMPYQYFWSNGAISEDINGLTAGSYSVTVRDHNDCEIRRTYTVYEPNPLHLEYETGHSEEAWFINLSVDGGLGPYTYTWSNGAETQDIFNLAPGVYTVTVSDDQNCSIQQSIEVGLTSIPSISTIHELVIFPNPAQNYITIDLEFPLPKKAPFQVVGLDGQIVLLGQLKAPRTRLAIDLPAGIYWFKTNLRGKPYFQKLAVMH